MERVIVAYVLFYLQLQLVGCTRPRKISTPVPKFYLFKLQWSADHAHFCLVPLCVTDAAAAVAFALYAVMRSKYGHGFWHGIVENDEKGTELLRESFQIQNSA